MSGIVQPTVEAPNPRTATRKLFVVGDSHCVAYEGLSLEDRPEVLPCVIGHALMGTPLATEPEKNQLKIDPQFLEHLSGMGLVQPHGDHELACTRDIICLSFGGCEGICYALDPIWKDYDFFLPEIPHMTDWSKRCLPLSLVRDWQREHTHSIAAALEYLRSVLLGDLCVVCPPPPHRSDEQCSQYLDSMNLKYCQAPVQYRVRLAWMFYRLIERICADVSVPFVDTWAISADDYILRPEYELDGYHANSRFGRVVLPHIIAAIT